MNEDEDDVTRKKVDDVEVVISPVGRSCGSSPDCVSALPEFGSASKLPSCLPLSNP